jgi:hypothetical protein
VIQGKGFGHVVVGPHLHGLHGVVHVAVAGDDDYLDLGGELLELGQQVQAAAVGKPHVEQRDIKGFAV